MAGRRRHAFLWTASNGAVGVREAVTVTERSRPSWTSSARSGRRSRRSPPSGARTSSPPPGTTRWHVSTALRGVRRSASTRILEDLLRELPRVSEEAPRRPSARGCRHSSIARSKRCRYHAPSYPAALQPARQARPTRSHEPRTPRPGRPGGPSERGERLDDPVASLEARTRPHRVGPLSLSPPEDRARHRSPGRRVGKAFGLLGDGPELGTIAGASLAPAR